MIQQTYVKVTNWSPFFMMKKYLLTLFLLVLALGVFSQQSPILVMFYNTENLFDTIDDPIKVDEEFTPKSELLYTSLRYNSKLQHIADVINGVDSLQSAPALVGLCEVENRAVLEDLNDRLSHRSYSIIHSESDDERGIDNALFYDTTALQLVATGQRSIDLGEDERPTRPILFAVFKDVITGKIIVAMVNHWPSRFGGQQESDWKRIRASQTLSMLKRDLSQRYSSAAYIAMGDFNDTPSDVSVNSLEKCAVPLDPCLVNLFADLAEKGNGTHAYKNEWSMLDQMLVSRNVINTESGFHASAANAQIFSMEKMLYVSTSDNMSYPSRTYSGKKYFGGYSDHLPILLTLYRN